MRGAADTSVQVTELVPALETAEGVLPVAFIGQSSKRAPPLMPDGDPEEGGAVDGPPPTGDSTRGLTQRRQREILRSFRQGGRYNVLVATCIGEEGLDIGDPAPDAPRFHVHV